MFYDQLLKLCKENKTTPTAATEHIGMSKGTMSNWKKGATPNGDVIVRFAELFNVSTDYLLTGKEYTYQTQAITSNTTDEKLLLNAYRSIDEKNKMLILQKAIELSKTDS